MRKLFVFSCLICWFLGAHLGAEQITPSPSGGLSYNCDAKDEFGKRKCICSNYNDCLDLLFDPTCQPDEPGKRDDFRCPKTPDGKSQSEQCSCTPGGVYRVRPGDAHRPENVRDHRSGAESGNPQTIVAQTAPSFSNSVATEAVDECLSFVREWVSNSSRKGIEIDSEVIRPAVQSCRETGEIERARRILLSPPVEAAHQEPVIVSFMAKPATIDPGDWVRLYWQVDNADSVHLFDNHGELESSITLANGELGWPLKMNGEQQENLHQSTDFRLVAVSQNGRVSQSFRVTVQAEAQTCAGTSTRLCRKHGADCEVLATTGGASVEVCRWSTAESADACANTVGIWTSASSRYARAHPGAVSSGSPGACLSEVENVRKIVD